jgi:hypothetical protein
MSQRLQNLENSFADIALSGPGISRDARYPAAAFL